MIHAVALIFKIIGWILLGILGIILGILLFVLFSAVRYQIDGEKKEKLKGSVKLTWLFWILSVTALYEDELSVKVKVFGRTVWKTQKTDPISELAESESHASAEFNLAENQKYLGRMNQPESQAQDSLNDMDSKEQEKTASEHGADESGRGSFPVPEERIQKQPFFSRIKSRIYFIKEWILSMIRKIQCSIHSICGKLKQAGDRIFWIRAKWEAVCTFIQDPANQKSAKLILRQIKKIFQYLLPRKGKAAITFGIEDPYQMGQILSAASILYPLIHNHISLCPVFDQKVLEGEVHIRGHIRWGVLFGYGLRLLLDGTIRKQIWNWIGPSKKRKRGNPIAT
jgi:hypothetical protein